MSGNNINLNNNSLCHEANCSQLTNVLKIINKPNGIDDVYNMCKNSPINHKCNLSTFNLHCDVSLCKENDCEKIQADHGGIDGLIKKCGGCHTKVMQPNQMNPSINADYDESLSNSLPSDSSMTDSSTANESQDYNTFKCNAEKSNGNWNQIVYDHMAKLTDKSK